MSSKNKNKTKNCKHQFDGGYCLDCHEAMPCALCEKNPWDSRCDICDSSMICSDCYERCDNCDQKYCTSCGHCDCDYWDYY